jgi:pre-mRNA-processing factor 19
VNLRPSTDNMMDDTEESVGLTRDVLNKMIATSEELSSQRKTRTVSPDLRSSESISHLAHKSSYPVSTSPLKALDVHSSGSLILTGSEDGSAQILNVRDGKILGSLKASQSAVNAVRFHTNYDLCFTGSADKTVKFWNTSHYGCVKTLDRVHSDQITGLALHATGDYLVSCSYDRTWAFTDINTGVVLSQHKSDFRFTSINFHPDGLIFATGVADNGTIKIFDVKSQQQLATFNKHQSAVTSLSFSENGYYMASSSLDGFVRVWDLRKQEDVHQINYKVPVRSVQFDYSGVYLTAGTDDGNVYVVQSKIWKELKKLERAHAGSVTGVSFGKNAQSLISIGQDCHVKIYE